MKMNKRKEIFQVEKCFEKYMRFRLNEGTFDQEIKIDRYKGERRDGIKANQVENK